MITAKDPITGWRRYYPRKPTMVYYITFTLNNTQYWKVGITTLSIAERFKYDHISIQVLAFKQFKGGRLAYILEQKVLHDNASCRYTSNTKVLRSGNTELLTAPLDENYIRSHFE